MLQVEYAYYYPKMPYYRYIYYKNTINIQIFLKCCIDILKFCRNAKLFVNCCIDII